MKEKDKVLKNNTIIKIIIFLVISLIILSTAAIMLTRNSNESKINENVDLPRINLENKAPEKLTWEEYMELSEEEKKILPDYFESYDEFKEWYDSKVPEIKDNTEDVFTVDLNGKAPEEFTWEEYKMLTYEEQKMFPDYFKSYDEFKEWLEKNKPKE